MGVRVGRLESLAGGIRPAPPGRIRIPAADVDAGIEPVQALRKGSEVPPAGLGGLVLGRSAARRAGACRHRRPLRHRGGRRGVRARAVGRARRANRRDRQPRRRAHLPGRGGHAGAEAAVPDRGGLRPRHATPCSCSSPAAVPSRRAGDTGTTCSCTLGRRDGDAAPHLVRARCALARHRRRRRAARGRSGARSRTTRAAPPPTAPRSATCRCASGSPSTSRSSPSRSSSRTGRCRRTRSCSGCSSSRATS